MSGNITCYDTILNSQFPGGAQAYAAYVDGGVGDQPNYDWIVAAFPGAQHLSIALNPAHDADALDIENGAAAPEDFPGWHARQVKVALPGRADTRTPPRWRCCCCRCSLRRESRVPLSGCGVPTTGLGAHLRAVNLQPDQRRDGRHSVDQ